MNHIDLFPNTALYIDCPGFFPRDTQIDLQPPLGPEQYCVSGKHLD